MSTQLLINLCYTAAAVLFIFGLKFLGSPATARRGNTLSALGMLLAVIVTLLDQAHQRHQDLKQSESARPSKRLGLRS